MTPPPHHYPSHFLFSPNVYPSTPDGYVVSNLAKKRQKMRLHHENLEKLYYTRITKVNFFRKIFPVIFLLIKSRLCCRKYIMSKDVFFE